jgi:pimeloyl-ACP methyl ester carboxylesterase
MFKVLALILAAAIASPMPTDTPQPDHFNRLAPLQFAVTTPQGSGRALYFSNGSLDGDKNATRALIVVHGILRDADYYYDTGMEAVHDQGLSDVIVISPQFVEPGDLKGQNVPADTLRWESTWPGGSPAVAPAPISSYAVFDAIVERLSDRSRFPKIQEIVIAGHSAGGQIVQRYATVGKARELDDGATVPVHLIVANPSSYFYFSDDRPVHVANCPNFNHWRYGITGAPTYVSGTDEELEEQYVHRRVTYLLGTADTNPNEDDLDRTCAGEAQGPYRFARGKNYIAYMRDRHPAGTEQDFAFVQGVPHDNRRMFRSACGLAVIFGGDESSCAQHGKI